MMTNAKDPNLQPESEASPLRAGEDACKKVLGSCDADLFEINLVNTEDQKLGQAWTGSPLFVVLCSTSSSSAVRSRCRMTSYLTRQARNRDLRKRTLLLTATPCVSLLGQINGAICIGQDVTRLKDLDERKASMMAMVSHELKSPLHGIIGLCSSLLDGNAAVEEGQVPRSLEMVYNCANRLLDMVANIMDTLQGCKEIREDKNL